MDNSPTFVLKSGQASLKLSTNPTTKKKLSKSYSGITLSLGKCQMPKATIEIKWKITTIADQRIFPILQYGLYQLCLRI